MKCVYKFHWDMGRMGTLDGVFIEDDKVVKKAIGKNVYFGEVFGKHSEVYGYLAKKDFTVLTNVPSEVLFVEEKGLCSGYNPMDYLTEEEDE